MLSVDDDSFLFPETVRTVKRAFRHRSEIHLPLLFTRLDRTYEEALNRATETLSVRYAMDFRKAAERYCALGTSQMVAEKIREFHAAGVRHVVLDLLGPYEQKAEQIAWFARDVLPLLVDLTAGSGNGRSAPPGAAS